jgi:hypothetical protein
MVHRLMVRRLMVRRLMVRRLMVHRLMVHRLMVHRDLRRQDRRSQDHRPQDHRGLMDPKESLCHYLRRHFRCLHRDWPRSAGYIARVLDLQMEPPSRQPFVWVCSHNRLWTLGQLRRYKRSEATTFSWYAPLEIKIYWLREE